MPVCDVWVIVCAADNAWVISALLTLAPTDLSTGPADPFTMLPPAAAARLTALTVVVGEAVWHALCVCTSLRTLAIDAYDYPPAELALCMPHLRSLRLTITASDRGHEGNLIRLLKAIVLQAPDIASLDLVVSVDEGGWPEFLDWCAAKSGVRRIALRGAAVAKASYTWIEVV